MKQTINLSSVVTNELSGLRLDQALAKLFPEHSRSRLQSWINNKQVLVNDKILRPRDKVAEGDQIVIAAELEIINEWAAQPITLDVVYEDEHLLVINKPVGLVVHPAVGNRSGTLLNALLHHAPELQHVPRAGIIHRLDKDTSGILVVAKTLVAHTDLVQQLQNREIEREYRAIVCGVMTAGGTVDAPIARHPSHRTKMAVVHDGKEAVTHYRVLDRFRAHTFIKVFLETGRTHQIRVHMAHIHYPIIGDGTYNNRMYSPKGATHELLDAIRNFKHQALHAQRLELTHPASQEVMSWETEIPADMAELLTVMRNDKA